MRIESRNINSIIEIRKGELEMRNSISNTSNFTRRDAVNSRNGIALQDVENGYTFNVISAAQIETVDEETGERKEVSVLKSDDNQYYTSISATVYDVMDDLIDIIDDEGSCKVRVDKRKSKQGRDFIMLSLF